MNSKILNEIFKQCGYIVETKSFISSNDVYLKSNNFFTKAPIRSWTNSVAVKTMTNATKTKLVFTDSGKNGATWIHYSLIPAFVQWNPEIEATKKLTIITRMFELMMASQDETLDSKNADLEEEVKILNHKLIKAEKAVEELTTAPSKTPEPIKQVVCDTELQTKYDTLVVAYRSILGDIKVSEFIEWKANHGRN